MRYIPATEYDIQRMLASIGAQSIAELFTTIPQALQLERRLDLPKGHSEMDLVAHAQELANQNMSGLSFLGGGAYHHYIPAVVDTVISRSEFATAYTPYQAEVAQGTLQAIFQMQTYVCELFGMDIANASTYEGASSLAEGALMALRMRRRYKGPMKVIISGAINPEYRQVLETYLHNTDIELVSTPWAADGQTDWQAMAEASEGGAIALIAQSPNYFGVIEDLSKLRAACDAADAAMVVSVTEPMSCGLIKPPGSFGADIVVGEGQGMGVPLSYGGPYVGLFATKKEYLRSMPGRLVGQTTDADGKRGYVLTLSTREQHIRREKATSNICTNAGLMALAFTVYTSLLGKVGFQELANLNFQKAQYLKGQVAAIPGLELAFEAPTFNEFAVRSTQVPVDELMSRLEAKGIFAGLPLGPRMGGDLEDAFLMTVTETHSRKALDRAVKALKEVAQ